MLIKCAARKGSVVTDYIITLDTPNSSSFETASYWPFPMPKNRSQPFLQRAPFVRE